MPLDRRRFIHVATGAATAALLADFLAASESALAISLPPLSSLDGIAQAQAIAKGEVTALEVLEAAIKQIERINPQLNAVVTTDFDRARDRAREHKFVGPFSGVPYLVKDLSDFAGVRTTKGSRAMLTNISKTTDKYVQAGIDAGLNVVGKSNTPEFGMSCTTESLALGPCYNPWNLKRSAGGSSGGAAAAVAAGMVPIAQGSDSGGSIRIPASCCGVFGLKPSRGRLIGSTDAYGFSSRGVLTRSVRDTAHALAVTERPQPAPGLKPVGLVNEPSKRRLTIGLYLKGENGVEPAADVADAVLATARLCEELGHDVKLSRIRFDVAISEDYHIIRSRRSAETVAEMEKQLGRKLTLQDVEPPLLASAAQYHAGWNAKYDEANRRVQKIAADINEQMREYDVVLSPVLRTAPPLTGEFSPFVPPEVLVERMINYVAYTVVFNMTGMPAMSVPLAWNAQGLPIGSQCAAKYGDERTLLELAYQLEAAKPWAEKWPPCAGVGQKS
jgi:amidase